MGVITIQDLKPGMVTAVPVKTTAGQLIIGKNTVLTEALITRMSFYNIQNVSVVDIKDTVEEEPKKIVAPEHELSYSQKVRKSSSFQKFQIDYTRHITNFNNYLKELVNTRTMNHATELVEIPKLLISETRTSIQFFDMIHNLRQIDDPIFAHSLNVAMIARMLGKWLHFSEADLDTLTLSAALHDVGKFLIPSDILNKETKLTDSEFALIKQHPVLGYDLLKELDLDYHVKQAALSHHERCDGSGYPLGLKADEIDSHAMIIAIADVYDAMTSARKYRTPLCPFEVIAEFEKDGLSKYKPKYILTFLEHIANAYQNNRILLNDGRSAKIILLNSKHLSAPMIQLDDGTCLDLDREPALYIKSVV
ncbi:MAG: HD-GYP domain-containing protein [Lachnospiraceae bacterium]|nr:HD-GYP domain-containing protein [Lachnospiraceae bacterium]